MSDRIKLRDVLGAVLKDITEARFQADKYSRDLSRQYERDDVLKTFPVPRSEIGEIDLNIGFAFDGCEKELPRIRVIKSRLNHIFSLYAQIMAKSIMANCRDYFQDEKAGVTEEQATEIDESLKELSSADKMEDLLETIFENLQWSMNFWINDAINHIDNQSELELDSIRSKLAVDTTMTDEVSAPKLVKDLVKLLFKGYPAPGENANPEEHKTYDPFFSEKLFGNNIDSFKKKINTDLNNIVLDMKRRLRAINSDILDINAYVKLDSETLNGLDSSKISSVTMKVKMQNYLWTEIDDNENRLIQE